MLSILIGLLFSVLINIAALVKRSLSISGAFAAGFRYINNDAVNFISILSVTLIWLLLL